MINSVSKKVVERLLRNDVITQEDYEIYLFGMEQLLTTFINLLTCVVVGVFLGSLLQTLCFVVAFIMIRSYAGGYHTSTPLKCYVLSTVVVVITVATLKYIKWNLYVLSALLVIASIVILTLAPVDTENKPIDDVEYVYFRKMTIKVLVIEVLLAIACMVFRYEIGAESIVGALVVLAIALGCEISKKERVGCYCKRKKV